LGSRSKQIHDSFSEDFHLRGSAKSSARELPEHLAKSSPNYSEVDLHRYREDPNQITTAILVEQRDEAEIR